MKQESIDKILKAAPNFYSGRERSISVGEGWFKLVLSFSKQMEKLILNESPSSRKFFSCSQLKEKFGSLRVYTRSSTNKMDDLIGKAEAKSAEICENCGDSAKVEDIGGWLSCICSKCLKKKKCL